jgi:predicted histidine transporter YuiF (NhaC family)
MTIMTICTLVLNAVIAVLLVGYGLWLRNIFTQQLSAKDTTIETLNAAVKLHEGEVAALKGDRAPAIAAEYKTMREHANQMTEEKQKLEDRVKNLTDSQRRGEAIRPVLKALSEMDGLMLAGKFLSDALIDLDKEPDTFIPSLIRGVSNVQEQITTQLESRKTTVNGFMDKIAAGAK